VICVAEDANRAHRSTISHPSPHRKETIMPDETSPDTLAKSDDIELAEESLDDVSGGVKTISPELDGKTSPFTKFEPQ
jgi:hypothetical protein